MEIGFKKLFLFLVRQWWILLAAALVGVLGGYLIANGKPESYRVTCQVKVQYVVPQDSNASARDTIMANVLETVRNEDFLERQFDAAGASDLIGGKTEKTVRDFVSISRSGSSDFLDVVCTMEKSKLAMEVVKNIRAKLNEEIARVLGADYASVDTMYEPRLTEKTDSRLKTALGGGILLLFVAAAGLVVYRLLDGRIYGEDEIVSGYEVAYLGSIKGGRRS